MHPTLPFKDCTLLTMICMTQRICFISKVQLPKTVGQDSFLTSQGFSPLFFLPWLCQTIPQAPQAYLDAALGPVEESRVV